MSTSKTALSIFVIAVAASSALADFANLRDRNRDGYINVLDVAAERGIGGLGGTVTPERGAPEVVVFDAVETFGFAGGEVRVLVLLDQSTVPLFGYSLDIDVAPVMGASGMLVPNASMTNYFESRNLISAGGATRDGLFSVIQLSPDGGVFVTTNTDDFSTVLATVGVNDVLAELVFDATEDAGGVFEITLGAGSALADGDGFAVPFDSLVATVTIAPPEPTGTTYYEIGDVLGSNDVFSEREVMMVEDVYDSYITGKLQENQYPGRYPDTYLFMFDKDDNVVCEDNDSSSKGNGKASGCFDIEPIPNGEDGGATIRLGITGRPDGLDTMFNGLFFNAPHEQLGEAEVCVTYYDDGGEVIGTDTYLCTFVTGAEAFRVNYVVPDGTATVDVEIDNTTEMFDICNDVDYYEINGLEPVTDYVITVIGGTNEHGGLGCEILAWFDKLGRLVYPIGVVQDRGEFGQGAQLSVIADVNGRVRLAVTGQGDENFDGWLDEADTVGRNIGTPGEEPPLGHGCCSCYTLKIEWIKKGPSDGEPPTTGGDNLLLLANGDLNLDGAVNVIDLAMLLNNWGWTAP